jgi:hypothetical protein
VNFLQCLQKSHDSPLFLPLRDFLTLWHHAIQTSCHVV